jgi:soluble lytic murein transglycosylase-like protein
MVRRLAEAVGTLTVVVGVAIVTMPSVRESTLQMARDLFTPEANAAPVESAAASSVDERDEVATGTLRLEPTDLSVARYLARRYHVADEAVRPLVLAAREAGHQTQLDPLLILAVMAVESSFNPFAESPVGAQGLMQVMTSVHSSRFGLAADPRNALEPIVNIHMGSAILSDLIHRGGSLERGLQLYVGAGNLRDDGGYASRVLSEMARLKTAAAGDVAGALAAGVKIDTKTVGSATPTSTPSSPATAGAAS